MSNRVEHPSYYQLENGLEIIDIIRYYTCDIANAMKYIARAGLKGEAGMTIRQKEVEDCRKAVIYLCDYISYIAGTRTKLVAVQDGHPSGVDCETIASHYCDEIADAFRYLWNVGLVVDGSAARITDERASVRRAIDCIEKHIATLLCEQE